MLRDTAVREQLRVDVWWEGMQQWYAGKIDAFDASLMRHHVKYDDGDTAWLQLWAPGEIVVCCAS